jgi:uncharacterized membrane protein
VPSAYRISSPLLVRILGVGLVAAGVLVLAVVVVGALLSWPVGTLLTVVAVLWVVLAALVLVVPRLAPVVRLDDVGYRVRWVRGAGVRNGRWKDVEDVVATTVAGARCVVLRRRDGGSTTIPVDVLAGSSDEFVRDLQQHLNRGHGYRPVS